MIQHQQRIEEVFTKMSQLEERLIGKEAIKEMLYVRTLCTAPQSQGRGYASALLNTLADIVSCCRNKNNCHIGGLSNILLGRLSTSGHFLEAVEFNVPFYVSNGYSNLGFVTVADENLTWGRDPINIYLVRQ
jgi:GNAT superfamily N-acetyltransferase